MTITKKDVPVYFISALIVLSIAITIAAIVFTWLECRVTNSLKYCFLMVLG